jgi:AcrR family transcriptional regulator
MTEPIMEPAVAAALRLAAERGWRSVSLQDVAAAAAVPLATLRRDFPCKTSLLVAYAQEVERRAAADPVPFEPEDTVRDRLFELLMQRLDILQESRPAVTSILRELPSDPLGAAVAGPEVLRLMAAILDRAGVPSAGPVGLLRCKGLAAIWLATLYVWARDDSPDHARTMAALDSNLRRVEPVARLLAGLPFVGGPSAAPGVS